MGCLKFFFVFGIVMIIYNALNLQDTGFISNLFSGNFSFRLMMLELVHLLILVVIAYAVIYGLQFISLKLFNKDFLKNDSKEKRE